MRSHSQTEDEATSPPSITPVFIVGCPRSGTTLVGNLVAANDSVFNGEESFFLYLMHNWEAMLRPPLAPLTRTFLERARDLMRKLIESETVARGKCYYVDHTPWHALCLETIWSVFEGARVVHVVRHPANVLTSLQYSYEAGYAWATETVEERVSLWHEFIQAIRPYENDERVRVIRYEDLCANPVQQTRALFDWVGLPWDKAVLSVFSHPHAANRGRRFALAEQTSNGLVFRAPPPHKLPAETLAALETVADGLHLYGYQLEP